MEHHEYPKYLKAFDVVAQSAAEEEGLLSGTHVVKVVQSAQGEQRTVVPDPGGQA